MAPMKRLATGAALVLALAACGEDNAEKQDLQPADLGLDSAVADLTADSTVDQQLTDQGLPRNSGALCTNADDCAAGDACLRVPGAAFTARMCLSPCMPGKACSVPDPVNNASVCALQTTDPDTGAPKYFCLWFCLRSNKTYQCPNEDDYACIEPLGIEEGTKICAPK